MALDCGCGSRAFQREHLVQVEIAPYDNVDVLAVNQRLPFPDDAFEAVLSFDVLEHVTNPFECAGELSRVLKPGGVLFLSMPFLSTEHGYPHHYFNATLEGIRQLFAGRLVCEAQAVSKGGHPSATVHQMLWTFYCGLPKAARPAFSAMTVGEILEGGPFHLKDAFGPQLAADTFRKMAQVTQGLFTKPGEGSGNLLDLELGALPAFTPRPQGYFPKP